jgi:hypothetical protein
MRFVDLTGKVIASWTVLRRAENNKHNHIQYLCRCICGTEKLVSSCNIGRHSTSCGCAKRYLLQAKKRLRPYEALYRNFLRKATHDNVLSYEDFIEFTRIKECHYCSDTVFWSEYFVYRNDSSKGYNLDRKDNAVGYNTENCVVCCARCNWAKGDHFTYEEWVEIGKLIRGWKK